MFSLKVAPVHIDEQKIIMQAVLKQDEFTIALCAAASLKVADPLQTAQEKAIAEVLQWMRKSQNMQLTPETVKAEGSRAEVLKFQQKLSFGNAELLELIREKFRKNSLEELTEGEMKLLVKHLKLVAGE